MTTIDNDGFNEDYDHNEDSYKYNDDDDGNDAKLNEGTRTRMMMTITNEGVSTRMMVPIINIAIAIITMMMHA